MHCFTMSQAYIRGDRCGVNNCPSVKWLHEDGGLRICENGHQKQGPVEAVEDEDTFRTIGDTHRIKKARLERVTKCKILGRHSWVISSYEH